MNYILESEVINSIIFLIYHLFCISVLLGFVIETHKRDKEDVSTGKCFIIAITILIISPIISPILLGAYLGTKIQKNL